MGKIAERLARRKSPEFSNVAELVKLALAAARTDEYTGSDPLYGFLFDQVEDLSAQQLNQTLNLFEDEVSSRPDAEDLREEVFSRLEDICTTEDFEDGSTSSLIAWPFYLQGAQLAWDVQISPDFPMRMQRILVDAGVIAEDCRIQMLPRVLSPVTAQTLSWGTLRQVTGHLSSGEPDQALELVAQELSLENTSNAAHFDEGAFTFGMFVFTVRSRDAFPMALFNEYSHALAEAESDEEVQEANDDCQRILEAVSQELTAALNCGHVQLLLPVGDWSDSIQEAVSHERVVQAQFSMHELLGQQKLPLGSALCFEPEFDLAETEKGPALQLGLRNKVTGVKLGYLFWPVLLRETPDEALEELDDFLRREHIEAYTEKKSSRRTVTATPFQGTEGSSSLH